MRQARRPTLHDVSAAAKVSIFTASRALNGESGVSARSRQVVLEAVKALGYVPNEHARNLKSARSKVVAVLTANNANQFYAELVSSIEAAVEPEGYGCTVMDAMAEGAYSDVREDRFVASLMAQRVAAVVVTYGLSEKNLGRLASWPVPLVFVDCPLPVGRRGFSVQSDGFAGSQAVGLHLAEHGRQRWLFVGHTPTWRSREPRQAGFEAAAAASDTSVAVVEGMNSSATARAAVADYLAATPRARWPDAVYASNTVLLHGAMRAIRGAGLKVPEDVAVVGFDEFEWAEFINPPLTVVDQNISAIGKAAGHFVLRQLAGEEGGEELVLAPQLRIRRSCGCGSGHAAR